jgi:hypothetical protein
MGWTIPRHWAVNYSKIVDKCLWDATTFENFRTHPHSASIVGNGMSDTEQTMLYNEITTKYPYLLDQVSIIQLIDAIGGPPTIQLPNNVTLCKRSLRYMWAAGLIAEHFGDIAKVVEIGCGYGGLCHSLSTYFDLDGYKLVDLKNVVALTRRVLSHLPTNRNDDFYEPEPPYSICVSESALSELDIPLIQQYYDEYISKSDAIYLRINFNNSTAHIKKHLFSLLNQRFDITISGETVLGQLK